MWPYSLPSTLFLACQNLSGMSLMCCMLRSFNLLCRNVVYFCAVKYENLKIQVLCPLLWVLSSENYWPVGLGAWSRYELRDCSLDTRSCGPDSCSSYFSAHQRAITSTGQGVAMNWVTVCANMQKQNTTSCIWSPCRKIMTLYICLIKF